MRAGAATVAPVIVWLLACGFAAAGQALGAAESADNDPGPTAKGVNLCRSVATILCLTREPLSSLPSVYASAGSFATDLPCIMVTTTEGGIATAHINAGTGCLIAFHMPELSKIASSNERDWHRSKADVVRLLAAAGLTARGVDFNLEKARFIPAGVIVQRSANGYSFLYGDHMIIDLAGVGGLTLVKSWAIATVFSALPEVDRTKWLPPDGVSAAFSAVVQRSPVVARLFGKELQLVDLKFGEEPGYVYENAYFESGEDPLNSPFCRSPVHLAWAISGGLARTGGKRVDGASVYGYVDVNDGKVVAGQTVPSEHKIVRREPPTVVATGQEQHVRSLCLAAELAARTDLAKCRVPSVHASESGEYRRAALSFGDGPWLGTVDTETGVVLGGKWDPPAGLGEALPPLDAKDNVISVRNELKRAKLFKQCGYYDVAIRFDWANPAVAEARLRFPRMVGTFQVENEYFEVGLAPRRPLRVKEIKTNCSFRYPPDAVTTPAAGQPGEGEGRQTAGNGETDAGRAETMAARISTLQFPAEVAVATPITFSVGEHPKYAAANAFFKPEDANIRHLEMCRILSVPARQGPRTGTVVIYWSEALDRPVGGRFDEDAPLSLKPVRIPSEEPTSTSPQPLLPPAGRADALKQGSARKTAAQTPTVAPAAQTREAPRYRFLVSATAVGALLLSLWLVSVRRRRAAGENRAQ